MPSKSEIIEIVSKSPEYKSIAMNIAKNNHLYKDLFQDGIIALMEMAEDKIIKLHQQNELAYYFSGILKKLHYDKNNRRQVKCEYIEEVGLPEKEDEASNEDTLPEEVEKIIDPRVSVNKIKDYSKALLKLSVELGGPREVAKRTGIKERAVYLSIENAKKKLKKKYGKN